MSDKKVIMITGASSGIGMASAIYFAKQGWDVAATMRDRRSLIEFKEYPNIKSFELDVTSVDSVQKLAMKNACRKAMSKSGLTFLTLTLCVTVDV